MATNSDESRSGSTTNSVHDGASSHTDSDSEPQGPKDTPSTVTTEVISEPSILLAEDPFGSGESKLLFEAIDKLRSRGAGQVLDLPQLVIVGKQSVGKSSLLESLTDIPFPVGDGLCTRFATRVISRRTAPGTPDVLRVSIEEGDVDPFGDSEDGSQTGLFKFPEDQNSMTAEYFQELVKKASAAMGISGGKRGSQKNFSSKVLKIELSGPRRSHFGILDLPGIFGAATGPITAKEREGVDKMVIAYMKRPQNIIICVADAIDNLANQRILSLAADHAETDRIVGVFTKCDMTDNPERIITIVENNEATTGKPLRHGWFLVQNRGHRDDPLSFDRENAETSTFSKEPWLKIEERRRGTAKLKMFLSTLLCRRIREGFPGMQKDVQERLVQERERLAILGKPRPTPGLQRAYLSDIALKFQILAGYALKAPENLPFDDMKLRGKAERAKDDFAEELRLRGHLYEFSVINETEVPVTEANQITEDMARNSIGISMQDRTLYDEIKNQIRVNQSEELRGMVNPAVLKPLLRKQTSKWPKLAEQHLDNVASLTEEAVLRILKLACEELGAAEYVREGLEQKVLKFAQNARSSAKKTLDTFQREERSLHLQTSNPTFIENVETAQLLRFKAALERYKKKTPPHNFMVSLAPQNPNSLETIPHIWKSWTIISSDTISALFRELHSHTEKNTQDEIHDLLKAYYEVAREDFITYVNRHVAEPFLQDEKGPVMGLCTPYINHLTDEEVEELGAEHESTIHERQMIEATIQRLEDAERIAQQALRKTRVLGAV